MEDTIGGMNTPIISLPIRRTYISKPMTSTGNLTTVFCLKTPNSSSPMTGFIYEK
jgi:hypothetical protein